MKLKSIIAALAISLSPACNNKEEIYHTPQRTEIIKGKNKDLQEIVLEKSKNHQTVHFGEFHDVLNDDFFVMSLLPKLKKQGFEYFAIELDSHEQPLVDSYINGKINYTEFRKEVAKISKYVLQTSKYKKFRAGYYFMSTMPIIKAAHKARYKVVLYDERPEEYTAPGDKVFSQFGELRDKMAFQNLKRKIFDKNPNAKVVIFSGRYHIDENLRVYILTKTVQKALGYFLEEYTHGKNLSVSLLEERIQDMLPSSMYYTKPDIALQIE